MSHSRSVMASQLSGHIPETLRKAFDMACIEDEITLSEGIEQAVNLWLEFRKAMTDKDDAQEAILLNKADTLTKLDQPEK